MDLGLNVHNDPSFDLNLNREGRLRRRSRDKILDMWK